MLNNFKFHHIGFIVDEKQKINIENKLNKFFILDPIQDTFILFTKDLTSNHLIEYILKTGRVTNSKTGFAHLCYTVNSIEILNKFISYIADNNLGFPITDLEKSISEECNYVKFFFMKEYGLIEINVENFNA